MGLLAGIVGTVVVNQIDQARTQTARAQIKQLESALTFYQMDNGRFPTTRAGADRRWSRSRAARRSRATTGPAATSRAAPCRRTRGRTPYQYVSPGQHNPHAFDLWTYGADGQPGGEGADQDVGNWVADSARVTGARRARPRLHPHRADGGARDLRAAGGDRAAEPRHPQQPDARRRGAPAGELPRVRAPARRDDRRAPPRARRPRPGAPTGSSGTAARTAERGARRRGQRPRRGRRRAGEARALAPAATEREFEPLVGQPRRRRGARRGGALRGRRDRRGHLRPGHGPDRLRARRHLRPGGASCSRATGGAGWPSTSPRSPTPCGSSMWTRRSGAASRSSRCSRRWPCWPSSTRRSPRRRCRGSPTRATRAAGCAPRCSPTRPSPRSRRSSPPAPRRPSA